LNPRRKEYQDLIEEFSFLQKSTKNVHVCGKLLTLYFGTNNQFSIAFKPPENLSRLEKIGDSQ